MYELMLQALLFAVPFALILLINDLSRLLNAEGSHDYFLTIWRNRGNTVRLVVFTVVVVCLHVYVDVALILYCITGF